MGSDYEAWVRSLNRYPPEPRKFNVKSWLDLRKAGERSGVVEKLPPDQNGRKQYLFHLTKLDKRDLDKVYLTSWLYANSDGDGKVARNKDTDYAGQKREILERSDPKQVVEEIIAIFSSMSKPSNYFAQHGAEDYNGLNAYDVTKSDGIPDRDRYFRDERGRVIGDDDGEDGEALRGGNRRHMSTDFGRLKKADVKRLLMRQGGIIEELKELARSSGIKSYADKENLVDGVVRKVRLAELQRFAQKHVRRRA